MLESPTCWWCLIFYFSLAECCIPSKSETFPQNSTHLRKMFLRSFCKCIESIKNRKKNKPKIPELDSDLC